MRILGRFGLTLTGTLFATMASFGQSPLSASPSAPAEIIFTHGVIYTGEGFADDKPQTVSAIAVGGGKLLGVGSDAEVLKLAGPKTEIRDLSKAEKTVFIFPGFNDAHTHLGDASRLSMSLDLTGVKSVTEMMARVAAFARTLPPGHWITGGNWDHTLWPDKKLPTRSELDRATAGHPAFLSRIDGHIAVANSAALTAAGVTGKTKAPEGGTLDLDSAGELTGILREGAKGLVQRVIPPPTPEERRRGDELAIADAVAHGITSVQDNSSWQDFLVFEELEKEGKLSVRISEWLPFNASLEELKRMREHHSLNDPMLHTGMLKGFMDGSLGSRTAALKAPYSDDPGNSGLPQYTQSDLNKLAKDRFDAGFQIGFHAIGDKAASMALDAFAQPVAPNDSRDRIEHAQVVDPAEIPRFKQLGVIASMQPNHLLTDMNWAEARLGPKRAAYSYAWKAFLDAGVPLAFGTDYPVEPITPFRGLYAAVTRMNEAGTQSYFPENKITRGQALFAYTQGSAYAEFAEGHKGKLAPGFDADFILVDRDLNKVTAPQILGARVLETYVSGRQVYLANVHAR